MTAATKELNPLRSLGPHEQVVVLALGIVSDRLARLDKQQSDVALALLGDCCTTNEDDRDAALTAIMELLEQAPVQVARMDLGDTSNDDPSGKLQQWKDYVSVRVRDCRNQKGLTQEQLAEKSGLPQSHISRIENAKHSPSRITLEKIARALGVPAKVFDPSIEDC